MFISDFKIDLDTCFEVLEIEMYKFEFAEGRCVYSVPSKQE